MSIWNALFGPPADDQSQLYPLPPSSATQQQMRDAQLLIVQAHMQSQYQNSLANQLSGLGQSLMTGPGSIYASGGGGGAWVTSSSVAWVGTTLIPPHQHSGRLKRLKHLPDTLGWRGWLTTVTDGKAVLRSPQQDTVWHDTELRCDKWCEDDVVRGVAGIHALLAPEHWQDLVWEYGAASVTGLVERFGKFVLGEDGWRAEWVIVRELCAPPELAAQLALSYPEVKIHIDGE